jgi:diguanylate cyclase (GGDEF)-like protein/putative nucleotidyltransferase with HDIG domain
MDEATESSRDVVTINSDCTVEAAATKMRNNNVACLVVTSENDKFIGLVTEQDIVCRAVSSSLDMEKTIVTEIMTSDVISCPPDTQVSKIREIMATKRIRHLPIVTDEDVVEMLSIRDVLQQQIIEDRMAAEHIAALSSCLKSVDLDEIANIITVEVPKIFQAGKCLLFLHRNNTSIESSPLVSFNGCICSEEDLESLEDAAVCCAGSHTDFDSLQQGCKDEGNLSQRVVVPLNAFSSQEPDSDKSIVLSGFLCLCELAPTVAANRELTSYMVRLVKEILNSHLSNIMLYQEAKLTSLIDPLTGVGSRRFLENELEAECARTRRYKRPFCVGIIDLDNFKTINDVLGHAAGDNTLRKLAKCMKDNKRAADILARYGGDEFVVLMPETKAEDAFKSIERIRTKIHEINIAGNLPMTISCGIAELSQETTDSDSEVIRRADIALYEAKSSGRDCVITWNEGMSKVLKTDEIEEQKIKKLKRRIAGLSEQSEKMFIQSIWGLVQALEAKDPYAKKHSENVMLYATGIAEAMKIAPQKVRVIRRAAMIHDIGKIGVPDAILAKPDTLTRHERSIVEQHPLIAVSILRQMDFLEREMNIVRHHHEKWNGQGYPDGLSATSIPFGARIMAVADTLDALTTNRSYHESKSVMKAVNIIVDSSGYDFDPKAVEGMTKWIENIQLQLSKKVEELTSEDLQISQSQISDRDTDSIGHEMAAVL